MKKFSEVISELAMMVILWLSVLISIVAAVITAAVITLLLLPKEAAAETIQGNPQACAFWGHQMRKLTVMRDNGISWADVEQEFTQIATEAVGQENSILQDKDDLKYVMEDAKAVWSEEFKGKSDGEVLIWTVQKCMARKMTL